MKGTNSNEKISDQLDLFLSSLEEDSSHKTSKLVHFKVDISQIDNFVTENEISHGGNTFYDTESTPDIHYKRRNLSIVADTGNKLLWSVFDPIQI